MRLVKQFNGFEDILRMIYVLSININIDIEGLRFRWFGGKWLHLLNKVNLRILAKKRRMSISTLDLEFRQILRYTWYKENHGLIRMKKGYKDTKYLPFVR